MINDILVTVRNVWDSMLGRVAILALALGWAPFALIGMALKAATKN